MILCIFCCIVSIYFPAEASIIGTVSCVTPYIVWIYKNKQDLFDEIVTDSIHFAHRIFHENDWRKELAAGEGWRPWDSCALVAVAVEQGGRRAPAAARGRKQPGRNESGG